MIIIFLYLTIIFFSICVACFVSFLFSLYILFFSLVTFWLIKCLNILMQSSFDCILLFIIKVAVEIQGGVEGWAVFIISKSSDKCLIKYMLKHKNKESLYIFLKWLFETLLCLFNCLHFFLMLIHFHCTCTMTIKTLFYSILSHIIFYDLMVYTKQLCKWIEV